MKQKIIVVFLVMIAIMCVGNVYGYMYVKDNSISRIKFKDKNSVSEFISAGDPADLGEPLGSSKKILYDDIFSANKKVLFEIDKNALKKLTKDAGGIRNVDYYKEVNNKYLVEKLGTNYGGKNGGKTPNIGYWVLCARVFETLNEIEYRLDKGYYHRDDLGLFQSLTWSPNNTTGYLTMESGAQSFKAIAGNVDCYTYSKGLAYDPLVSLGCSDRYPPGVKVDFAESSGATVSPLALLSFQTWNFNGASKGLEKIYDKMDNDFFINYYRYGDVDGVAATDAYSGAEMNDVAALYRFDVTIRLFKWADKLYSRVTKILKETEDDPNDEPTAECVESRNDCIESIPDMRKLVSKDEPDAGESDVLPNTDRLEAPNNHWWDAAQTFFKDAKNGNSIKEPAKALVDELTDMIFDIGNMIFIVVTSILGLRYIFAAAEGKASIKDSLATLVVAAMFFYGWQAIDSMINIGSLFADNSYETAAKKVYNTILFVVNLLAISGIIWIGVKYMMSSAEGKASIKTNWVPAILGIVMVYATIWFLTTVLSIAFG